MVIVTYGLIGIYAILTGLVGIVQWKERGFQIQIFLFVVISISMLITLFLPNKNWLFIVLIVIFIIVHILSICEGVRTKGQLSYSHHIIRFIFHSLLVLLVYEFIK